MSKFRGQCPGPRTYGYDNSGNAPQYDASRSAWDARNEREMLHLTHPSPGIPPTHSYLNLVVAGMDRATIVLARAIAHTVGRKAEAALS